MVYRAGEFTKPLKLVLFRFIKRSKIDLNSVEITTGLWQGCGAGQCVSYDCSGTSSSCSKIEAGRAFMTLACIFSALSTFGTVFLIFKNENKMNVVSLIVKGLAGFTVILGLIGVAISASTLHTSGTKLGPAAIVAIVGLILNAFGAALVAAI